MNEELFKPFTTSKVHCALKQMDSKTAPGLDGLLPFYHKHYWEKIEGDIMDAVLSVLDLGVIPDNLNHFFFNYYCQSSKSPKGY